MLSFGTKSCNTHSADIGSKLYTKHNSINQIYKAFTYQSFLDIGLFGHLYSP
jgi:hypothetical protein